MKVIIVSRDLMFASRIAAIAAEAGVPDERVDEPGAVLATARDVVVLEWDDRGPLWAGTLARWMKAPDDVQAGPRVIAAVSHRDRAGIQEAKAAGVRHVVARSGLAALLRSFLGIAPSTPAIG